MKYKYLLFDLDGTLFDYDDAELKALKQTFFDFGIKYRDTYLGVYQQINHDIWRDFEAGKISQEKLKTERFSKLAAALEMDFNSFEFSHTYLQNLSKGTKLIKGAEKIVRYLSGKAKLVLITNGLTAVQKPRIRHSSIGYYFEHIVISEEIGCAKPEKNIFDHTFMLLGDPDKNEVLIIGDSLTSDITGGSNYGIATCLFNPENLPHNSHPEPDFEIQRLTELIPILR
jgi:2-haloacid dehalogenase